MDTVTDADADLMETLRRGDARAAEQLVERYGTGVYRLALHLTGVTDDAETVAADTLAVAARRIDTFTSEPAFASWIHRTAATAAYEKLRARRPSAGEVALDDLLPSFDADGRHFGPMDDWSRRVEDGSRRDELDRILSEALAALPADYRAALVLYDVEGMSSLEIGETLGISPPGVKSRVHRARLFVRKRLSESLAV